MCPLGPEMEIQGQLLPKQEVQELDGVEVSSGRKGKKKE